MKVFLTGGTGYIGRKVTSALATAGFEVTGLVRTLAAADHLTRLGGTPILGDITDPTTYENAVAQCEAVIHLAQQRGPDTVSIDRATVQALAAALHRAARPAALIYTSTLFVLGNSEGEVLTEFSKPRPQTYVPHRAEIEQLVLSLGSERVATSVVRPGMVYGGGDGGTISELFRSAHEDGVATYIGDGRNIWTLIHQHDLATLFVLMLQKRAEGIYHAVDEHPLEVRKVAEHANVAAGSQGAVRSIPLEEARTFLGTFADALVLDQPATAPRARELGWTPKYRTFEDSAAAAFAEWKSTR